MENYRIAVLASASDAKAVLGWSLQAQKGNKKANKDQEESLVLVRDVVLPRAHENSVDSLTSAPIMASTASKAGYLGCVASSSRNEEHARVYTATYSVKEGESDEWSLDLHPCGAANCVPGADAGIASVALFVEPAAAGATKATSGRAHLLLGSALMNEPLTVWNMDLERMPQRGGAAVPFVGAVTFEASLAGSKKNKKAGAKTAKLLQGVARADLGLSALAVHPVRPTLTMSGSANGELTLWDLQDGRVAFRRSLGATKIDSIAWSPNGHRFSLLMRDDHKHTQRLVVFDSDSGDITFDTTDAVALLSASSATFSNHPSHGALGVSSHDMADVRATLHRPISAVFIDNEHVLIGGDLNRAALATQGVQAKRSYLVLINVKTHKVVGCFLAHSNRIRDLKCVSICEDPSNPSVTVTLCASACSDGFLKLWKLEETVDENAAATEHDTPTNKWSLNLIAETDTGARITAVCLFAQAKPTASDTESISAAAFSASAKAPALPKDRQKRPREESTKKVETKKNDGKKTDGKKTETKKSGTAPKAAASAAAPKHTGGAKNKGSAPRSPKRQRRDKD